MIDPAMMPATIASMNATAALMTRYSPDRNGMAARSSRCSRAPCVSMRPKMPAMRTVRAESSPRSGDSLTTSTGTAAVPMVSSRIWASVRLPGADPHDDGHDDQGQPTAHEDGRDERPRCD